ncbi:unnamed protein product [Spirodela intermedia]|uniref:SH2 domain-containing protein n=1 Tax=Spirodela intermedia TaxID=51605 RepID=A0ABN7E8D7_SPIIN|nr:unnamed protein product [Spirodela intermedia]
MKWVVESSPAAVTQRSGKTATLRLSGGCHPTERSWMEVGRVSGSFILRSAQQGRLFIASVSRVYDHSLPHSRLATDPLLTCFNACTFLDLVVWNFELKIPSTSVQNLGPHLENY